MYSTCVTACLIKQNEISNSDVLKQNIFNTKSQTERTMDKNIRNQWQLPKIKFNKEATESPGETGNPVIEYTEKACSTSNEF